jgi:hypothetical protein
MIPATWRTRALRDGLTWVGWSFPGNAYDCGSGHLAFMAVNHGGGGGYGYHWWRLDQKNGFWSQKDGGNPATNLDDSDQLILNPLEADRGFYTESGGFYCVCGGMMDLKTIFDINP